jgi:RHS repeat-associated protein
LFKPCHPDLVFGHPNSNKISILLGDGQGNLGAPRQITVEGLTLVDALAIGDFNGDGKQDIAVGGRRAPGTPGAVVAILLGNGDGSFQLAGTFPVGAPVLTSIAVGDFRGVGKQDLVFASWATSIPILFGNGDGSFQPPRLIPVAQSAITAIAIGDFNGDGKQDLVAIIASGALFILLGNGNGTFGTATPVPVGIQLRSVAVADVNEDGKQDLVAVTPFSPRRVVILIGKGDGTFQLPAKFFPLLRPSNVTNEIKVADFNGDGHQDLAVLNDDSVSVLLGDGHGNFPTRLDYAGEPSPTDLAVGDFNSDGKSDLALATQAASKTVSLLLSFPSSSPGDYSRLTRDTGTVCNTSLAFTRAMKDGTKIHFNAQGQHLATVDRNNNTTCYRYDEDGALTSITDPVGLVTTFTYAEGRLDSVRDPAGRVTRFIVDEAGDLVSITDPTGAAVEYAYDEHRLVSRTHPRGFSFSYEYNFAGRFVRSTLSDKSTRETAAAQMAGLVDPASGLGTRTQPAPHTLTSSVTASFTDGNGNRIVLGTGASRRLASKTDGEGRRTETLRDGHGNPTKITDANGAVTINTYDARGNLLSTTNRAINATTTYTYEPRFNQVASIRDPRGNTTRFEYDDRGNQTMVIDALGTRTRTTYDSRGLVETTTRALGTPSLENTTRFTYDAGGNLHTITDPLGSVATLEYDAAGNVTRSIDAEGNATVYTYDAMNRLTTITDARGGVTAYSYEPGCCGGSTGLISSITDAEDQTTTFEYDSMERLANITNPLEQTETFRYDGNGNLLSSTDARGRTITFAYDRANQLIRKIRPAPDSTIEYRYDRVGNLEEVRENNNASVVTMRYDAANRLTTVTTGGTILPPRTITYVYDAVGNRTRMVDPAESQGGTTLYEYDQLNRLRRLTNPRNQGTGFEYDVLSRRAQLELANGTSTTYGYDAASRLTSLITRHGQTTLASFQYTYDRIGNRGTMTEIAGQNRYAYDEIYRLTNATHPQAFSPEESFEYDAVGNRLASHLSTTYVYNEANRLLQDDQFNYTYDANGNLISKGEIATSSVTRYNYNSENQLIRIDFPDGTFAAYDYDGLGRRIRKNVDGVITKYIYDKERILFELGGSNEIVARYSHGLGIDEPLSVDRDGQSFFYHADGLGSIGALSNASGAVARSYVYDSFGNIVQQTGSPANFYTYTARESDAESGLYYYRARYYDSKTGRFLQEDPIWPAKTPNLYVYVENNPLNFVDPTGKQTRTPTTPPLLPNPNPARRPDLTCPSPSPAPPLDADKILNNIRNKLPPPLRPFVPGGPLNIGPTFDPLGIQVSGSLP